MKFKLLLIFSLFLPLLFLNVGKALAENSTAVQTQERLKNRVTNICNRVTNRVEWHLKRYNDHKTNFSIRVQNFIDRVNKINQRLQDRGCDTTKLEADFQQLKTLSQKWADDYNAFLDLLNESKTLACGESQGAYKAKIQEARDQLTQIRADVTEVKAYYNGTIKPDYQTAKEACRIQNLPTPKASAGD